MRANSQPPDHDHPADASQYPCLCAALRRAGRMVTKEYDRYLKPSGLKITQFSMLANLARNPDITVSKLARLLLMDQTTVTRNLGVLEKAGYISLEPQAADRRVKVIRLNQAGEDKMAQAKPYWQQAQRELAQTLGPDCIEAWLSSFQKLSG